MNEPEEEKIVPTTLTATEERMLVERMRLGDEMARRRLIEVNQRLVLNIAKTYRRQAIRANIPFEELLDAGKEGLNGALDRFDPQRGFRLSTYATHWIRLGIGRRLDGGTESLPEWRDKLSMRSEVQAARVRLWQAEGIDPSLERLAKELGLPEETIRRTMTRDEELFLTRLQAIQRGDEEAIAWLLEFHGDLVERIVRSVHHRFWKRKPLEDLRLAGRAGLLQAAEGFDPEKGFRFSTYATHHIRQSVVSRLHKA